MNKVIPLLFFLCCLVHAEEKAFVTTEFKKQDKQWLGQRLTFNIVLHSPTWFSGSPRFEIPELKDAVIFKVPGSPLLGNIEIDEQSYTTQSHSFALFTRKEGLVNIPAFKVEFGIAQIGKPAKRISAKSNKLSLFTNMPPSLEGKAFIVSENLSLDEKWDKKIGNLKVGDSLKRSITRKADNTLAMLLTPLKIESQDGLSVYPDSPKVNDSMNRGEFSASRTESFTYVFEQKGKITLPEIKIYSWNPKKERVEEHLLEKLEINIIANPLYKKPEEVEENIESENNRSAIWLILIIAFILCLVFKNILINRYKNWRKQKLKSEKHIFAEFTKKAPDLNLRDFYIEADLWVKKLKFESLKAFIDLHGSAKLIEQYAELNASLFGPNKKVLSTDKFIGELKLCRLAYLKDLKNLKYTKRALLGFG